MKDFAFSKINLSLVVGQLQGQFHPLDSIVVSVRCGDVVRVAKRRDGKIVVHGCKGIDQQNNVAYKAAQLFAKEFGVGGCSIRIKKRIPMCAGMGGSSADAAAVVRCLCKLHGVDIKSSKVHQLCATLGSDVNFLLFGGLARMTGKGDDLQFFAEQPNLHFAVTTFNQPLLAKDVFAAFDSVGAKANFNNQQLLQGLLGGDQACLHSLCNDLQSPATSLSPFANDYLAFCKANGLPCCMTGSGSAFFVAFFNKKQAQNTQKLLKRAGFNTFVCSAFYPNR